MSEHDVQDGEVVTDATEAVTEIALRPQDQMMTVAVPVAALLGRSAIIQQAMQQAMREDEHFGTIPGTKKPTLLKPGAEKLCVLFNLRPEYQITRADLPDGHREYQIICNLLNVSGDHVGQGLGLCSTLETKYRWRTSERICPECGNPAIIKGRAEYGGGWVCFKKKGGCGAKWTDGDALIEDQTVGRCENPDLADTWNTVLKMSKKRALVDAVLTTTAASDVFTQDMEETVPEPRPAQGQGGNGNSKDEPDKEAPAKPPFVDGAAPAPAPQSPTTRPSTSPEPAWTGTVPEYEAVCRQLFQAIGNQGTYGKVLRELSLASARDATSNRQRWLVVDRLGRVEENLRHSRQTAVWTTTVEMAKASGVEGTADDLARTFGTDLDSAWKLPDSVFRQLVRKINTAIDAMVDVVDPQSSAPRQPGEDDEATP
jgi:hypothetical protein